MKLKEYRKLNNPLSHCAVIIGVDPGVSTGVAVGSAEDPTLGINFQTITFWEAYDFIKGYNNDHTGIIIEVPTSKRMYERNDGNTSNQRARESMTNRMGSNRREAELLADGLERLGYPVKRVTPRNKKWKPDDLLRNTGIRARTNEHVRDAIRLVHEYLMGDRQVKFCAALDRLEKRAVPTSTR